MKKILVFLLVMAILLLTFIPVMAQASTPPVPIDPLAKVMAILEGLGSLVGFAALTALVVNTLKSFGVVKDGTSGAWFAGLSLLEIAFLVVCAFYKPEWSLPFLDAQAGAIATILTVVVGYVTQLGAGWGTHAIVSNFKLPVIGFSFSNGSVPAISPPKTV